MGVRNKHDSNGRGVAIVFPEKRRWKDEGGCKQMLNKLTVE